MKIRRYINSEPKKLSGINILDALKGGDNKVNRVSPERFKELDGDRIEYKRSLNRIFNAKYAVHIAKRPFSKIKPNGGYIYFIAELGNKVFNPKEESYKDGDKVYALSIEISSLDKDRIYLDPEFSLNTEWSSETGIPFMYKTDVEMEVGFRYESSVENGRIILENVIENKNMRIKNSFNLFGGYKPLVFKTDMDLYGENGYSGPQVPNYYSPVLIGFNQYGDGFVSRTIKTYPEDYPLSEVQRESRKYKGDYEFIFAMNSKNPNFKSQLSIIKEFLDTNYKFR